MGQDETASGRSLTQEKTSSNVSRQPATVSPCDPITAAEMATQLFRCYRASDANDPDAFIAATAKTFTLYPASIVSRVCDPVHGLPSEDKWLPSIAEIRQACEKLMAPQRAEERRARERDHTRRVSGVAPPPTPASIERVRALADRVIGEIAATRPLDPPVISEELRRIIEDKDVVL
jgi:hypothetical protein